MQTDGTSIRIKGARQHNLKNLDLEIPRNRLVVITGLSGSGKSSLAFDTLYAEGQRKYLESLSAYARQFLDRMEKPEVDFIEGLCPSIAIEQRSAAVNPRSTIATTTEIYDYLRLLFASVGTPHDPATGEPVVRQSPQQIADAILQEPPETRLTLLAPLVQKEAGEFRDVIEKARREGFVRLRIDGEVVDLGNPEPIRLVKSRKHTIEAVVDRLIVREGISQRLADSIELALRWGGNQMSVLCATNGQADRLRRFSTDFCNPSTGFTLPKLTPKHFSFNSHLGACPECHGLGVESYFDGELMLDLTKSLENGAIRPWRHGSVRMKAYYTGLLDGLARDASVPLDKPLGDLPETFRESLLLGTGDRAIEFAWGSGSRKSTVRKPFEGLIGMLERLYATSKSEITRHRLRGYRGQRQCRACAGARLRPEILAVTVSNSEGKQFNIQSLCALPISKSLSLLDSLRLSDEQRAIASDVLHEIRRRLEFLDRVGLGYLTLTRESATLSGGEAQRIRLATQIGGGLAGVLYVLDEPSIGLHQRDNDRLIQTLRDLRDLGNTVIVVEHDEDTIRAADHIIDMGPGAGERGGRVMAQGSYSEILTVPESLTAHYLNGSLAIPVPKRRAAPGRNYLTPGGPDNEGWLTIEGARENNLKNVTASFPVGCLTCVTGVSGSGKSTLINDILKRAIFRRLHGSKEKPGEHSGLLGVEQFDSAVVVDQTAIGKSPRSNPATYTGVFGPIRELFSQTPAARIRGYDAGRFSFNVKGGRCETCKGDGVIKIEMHFLSDVFVTCEACRGLRYNRETLEITYKGKNIADVLAMTVDEAARFFRNVTGISDKLSTLQDVGLGYLRLGQSGATLSGGEAQRVKLATELAKRSTGRTLYLLDEPTTGLHFADIHKLLEVLMKLRDARNTLIVIEHNLHVIKCADWIVDLGPEGGEAGGGIVACGVPEAVATEPASITGRYLKAVLS